MFSVDVKQHKEELIDSGANPDKILEKLSGSLYFVAYFKKLWTDLDENGRDSAE